MITPDGEAFFGGRKEILRGFILAKANRGAVQKDRRKMRRKIELVEVAGETAILRILQRMAVSAALARSVTRGGLRCPAVG